MLRRLLPVCALALVQGCENPFESARTVRLMISGLEAPATVSPVGPLTVDLVVVTGGCVTFERIEGKWNADGNGLSLQAIGKDASRPGIVCTSDIRYETHSFIARGPFTRDIVVAAVSPGGGGATLTRFVRLE